MSREVAGLPLARMHQPVARAVAALAGAGISLYAFGMYSRAGWATRSWPWPDVRMSYIFVASIAMAIAAPLLWTALRDDLGALAPVFFETSLIFPAMGGYFLARTIRHDQDDLLVRVPTALATALASLLVYRWSRAIPLRDRQPLPRLVTASFAFFVAVLTLTGGALVLQVENVFPWDLEPGSSTLFGLMFLGAALLFGWILAHRSWSYAEMALVSFLAYDLVLIIPYVQLGLDREDDSGGGSLYGGYGGTSDELNVTSLVVYLTVIGYSAILAVAYLFLHPRTRVWSRREEPAPLS